MAEKSIEQRVKELGGEIPEAEAEKLQTVGEVITYIEGKASAKKQ